LQVHVGAVLLGIGGTRQHDIGAMRALVAVMALIDDEGLAKMAGIDLIGAEQIDELDLPLAGAGKDAGRISPRSTGALPRREAELQATDPRCRGVQYVEAVPAVLDQATAIGDLLGEAKDRGTV